jgi:hypothetical protein
LVGDSNWRRLMPPYLVANTPRGTRSSQGNLACEHISG